MKLMLDMNVLLDVFQEREALYEDSATVISCVVRKEHEGVVPGHAITTLYYLMQKHAERTKADDVTDWMLKYFTIVPSAVEIFRRARQFNAKDFEDAVVMAMAEQDHCDYIITKNIGDFTVSPIKALTPAEFLAL